MGDSCLGNRSWVRKGEKVALNCPCRAMCSLSDPGSVVRNLEVPLATYSSKANHALFSLMLGTHHWMCDRKVLASKGWKQGRQRAEGGANGPSPVPLGFPHPFAGVGDQQCPRTLWALLRTADAGCQQKWDHQGSGSAASSAPGPGL